MMCAPSRANTLTGAVVIGGLLVAGAGVAAVATAGVAAIALAGGFAVGLAVWLFLTVCEWVYCWLSRETRVTTWALRQQAITERPTQPAQLEDRGVITLDVSQYRMKQRAEVSR